MKRVSFALCLLSVVAVLTVAPPAQAHSDCSFDWRHPAFGLGAGGNGYTTAGEVASPGKFSATARNFEYYTRAWFDWWLKGQTSAKDTLLETSFNSTTRDAVLSDMYHSAAAFDGVNCPDLRDPARPSSCDA
jgi:hypothetical protein